MQDRIEDIHVVEQAHNDRTQVDQKSPDKILIALQFIGNGWIEDFHHLIDHIQKLCLIDPPHLTHDSIIARYCVTCGSGIGNF